MREALAYEFRSICFCVCVCLGFRCCGPSMSRNSFYQLALFRRISYMILSFSCRCACRLWAFSSCVGRVRGRGLAVQADVMSERVPRLCPRCGERFRKDATCNTKDCLNFRPSATGTHLKDMNQKRTGARSMNKVVKRLTSKLSYEACVASGRVQSIAAYKASPNSASSPHSAPSPNSASRPNCESSVRSPSSEAGAQVGEPTWATPPFAAKPAAAQPDLQARAASTAAAASELLPQRGQAKRRQVPSCDDDFARAALRLITGPAKVAAPRTPPRKSTAAKRRFQSPPIAKKTDTHGRETWPGMRAAWRDLGCSEVGGVIY